MTASVPAVGTALAASVPAAGPTPAASVPAAGSASAASVPAAGSTSAASVPAVDSCAGADVSTPGTLSAADRAKLDSVLPRARSAHEVGRSLAAQRRRLARRGRVAVCRHPARAPDARYSVEPIDAPPYRAPGPGEFDASRYAQRAGAAQHSAGTGARAGWLALLKPIYFYTISH